MGLSECELACGREHERTLEVTMYSYASGAMVPWPDLMRSTLDLRESMALCRKDTFMARVTVDGAKGAASDVVIGTPEADAFASACLAKALSAASYPKSSASYTFAAQLDPRFDRSKLLVRRMEQELEETKKTGDKAKIQKATIALWELKQSLTQRAAEIAAREKAKAQTPPTAAALAAPTTPPASSAGLPPPMYGPGTTRPSDRPMFEEPETQDSAEPTPLNPGSLISPRSRRSSSRTRSTYGRTPRSYPYPSDDY